MRGQKVEIMWVNRLHVSKWRDCALLAASAGSFRLNENKFYSHSYIFHNCYRFFEIIKSYIFNYYASAFVVEAISKSVLQQG